MQSEIRITLDVSVALTTDNPKREKQQLEGLLRERVRETLVALRSVAASDDVEVYSS